MKLLLAQHGVAQSKQQDPQRPLSEAGIADVNCVANFMHESGITVERVIHSGKLRAQQTAEIFAKVITTEESIEVNDALNPNDDPTTFCNQIENSLQDTLVVGHLPFMSNFFSLLALNSKTNAIVSYQPGSVVCLEKNDEGFWLLNWMIRPELLTGNT